MSNRIQLIYIVGDLHGKWNRLNSFINEEIRNDPQVMELCQTHDTEILLFQCGDFGYMPKISEPMEINNFIEDARDCHVKIFFCDGNHEDHNALDKLEKEFPNDPFIKVGPHVYFATFGSIYTLANCKNVMFCGGAMSTDKQHRTLDVSWWAQEAIDHHDMARLPEDDTRINYVISHTCPNGFYIGKPTTPTTGILGEPIIDSSRQYLSKILDRYSPEKWWFGHYHNYTHGVWNGCTWTGLSNVGDSEKWYDLLII